VRLASSSSAAARQTREDKLRRDRAAARAIRLEFPTVQWLRLELSFDGTGPRVPASQVHVMHPPARAFFEFPCPYADCDGQFNLASAVSAALDSEAARTSGMLECTGLRAKDHASKQPCKLHLHYTISPEYR
jgi:hypothetical protein